MVECRISQPIENALASEAGSGMALPLLPTIVVAVIVSAASFLCQTPSAPVLETPVGPPMVEMESRTAQANPAEADPTVAFVPAALAFRDQFPLRDHGAMSVAATGAVTPPRRPAARVAAKPTLRRTDPARSETARAESARPDAVRVPSVAVAKAPAVAPEPFRVEAEAEEDLVPRLALPFAPAISAISRAGSFVGTQSAAAGAKAVALGNVVTGLVDSLPLRP